MTSPTEHERRALKNADGTLVAYLERRLRERRATTGKITEISLLRQSQGRDQELSEILALMGKTENSK